MRNKKIPLYVPILWFVVTGIWFATFCLDLYYGTTPTGLVVMHCFCVVSSLAAAVSSLIRYNKQKEDM